MFVFRFFRSFIAIGAALLMLFGCNADANEDLKITQGYARATFPMAKTAAVYFTLENTTEKPVTLTRVTVSKAIASEAQIHTATMQGDMMKMQQLQDGIKLNAGETVEFSSGRYHVMLMGLTQGLEEGSEITMTFHFDSLGSQTVTLPVKKQTMKNEHLHH